jgi:hypothetical protein
VSCDYRDPCSCGYVDPDPEATKKSRERWSKYLALNDGKPAAPSLAFAPAVDEAWAKHIKHLQLLGEWTYRRGRR